MILPVILEESHPNSDVTAPVSENSGHGLIPRPWTVLIVVLLAAIGLALRLYFALGPHSGIDSDEAIVGLMAFRLVHHHELPTAFFWNQNYGGSLEAVFVAPFVWALGTTTLALRTASVLFELVTVWLTWRVARRLFNPWVAGFVGVVALAWPLALVWFGTRERGFYPLTAALGMLCLLFALRIDDEPAPAWNWIGLGFTAGVGWWMSVNIAYYALPIALWLILRGHVRQLRNIAFAAGAFVLGAVVWIGASVNRDWETLHGPEVARASSYAQRFGVFWRVALPTALGLRRTPHDQWYGPGVLAFVCYVAVLALAVVAVVLVSRRRGPERPPMPEIAALLCSPFLFAAFKGNYVVGDGRYVYFVASLTPLLLGRIVETRIGIPVVAAVLGVATIGFVSNYQSFVGAIPGSTRPIAAQLRAAGYRTATGNYWTTFKTTYESGEKIIAAPLPGQPGTRYPRYGRIVISSMPAFVFLSSREPYGRHYIQATLRRAHISYRIIKAGEYTAVLPDRRKRFLYVATTLSS